MRNGVIKAFKRPRHIKRSVGEHILTFSTWFFWAFWR